MNQTRRFFLKLAALCCWWRTAPLVGTAAEPAVEPAQPFGSEFANLDSCAVGQWWNKPKPKGPNPPPTMDVPRNEVVAFALYTQDRGVLKLTAQLYTGD